MKKIIFILLTLFFAFTAFAQEFRGMYVNSREGLNIRKSPSMSAEKIGALKYGEYIGVVEEGEIVTIDGIKAPWTKILIDYDGSAEDNYRNCGWVFGGYLQKECPMSEKEIIAYLKKLSAEDKDFLNSNYFPKNPAINYMQNPSVYFELDGAEWQKPNTEFSQALPNYACQYWGYQTENEVVAVRDCFIYCTPSGPVAYNWLRFVKAGTKFKVKCVSSWGIEDGTLFPIYWNGYESYIRGIDFTGANCVSQASDGKGGFHTLVYQQLLEDVSMKDVQEHSQWEREKLSTSNQLEKYLSHELTYEGRWLRGGFETNFAEYTDPQGKTYRLSIGFRAKSLKLLYPLNMDNPVPILQADSFSGGMGGGYSSTKLSTLEAADDGAYLREICEYGYTSADVGYEGLAYHYFDDDGVYVYQYQKDDMGNIEENQVYRWVQYGSRYNFNRSISNSLESGEPKGKSQSLKIGQYVNPICRLKMRQSPDRYSRTLLILKPGTLLKVVEVGERQTIDGLSANWVKVEPVNDDKSVEGNVIKDWLPAEETAAWVFGAYLE